MSEEPTASGRSIRCYISAPIGANVEHIRSSLIERNVKVLTPSVLSKAKDLPQSARELIANADLIIGVLRRGRQSQAVLFELGMAAAMERKIVVFDSPRGGYVPSNLQSHLVLRVGLRNREAIDFALDQILLAPVSKRNTSRNTSIDSIFTRKALPSQILGLSSEVEKALEVGDGRRFEEIISAGIRNSGVEVAVEPMLKNREMDLAVWADEFQHFVGNPLLIETRFRLRDEEQVRSALKQCAAATERSGGRWSLLIYGSGPRVFRTIWLSLAPNVLVISASDLFERMRDQSFIEVVISLRNLRVHGGEY